MSRFKMIFVAIISLIVVLCLKNALAKPKVKRVLTLTENNHVFFSGTVSETLVNNSIKEIAKLDEKLKPGKPIYIVLDTPGGSILAGWKYIQFVKSLDRPVHTVTIFAASVGFQFVQAFNNRYITNFSILMSHHGSAQCQGTLIEIDNCANMLRRIDKVENDRVAKRVGWSPEAWSKYIEIDRWFFSTDAVKMNMADEVIGLKCSIELKKKEITVVRQSSFGSIKIKRSACPLM